MRFNELLPEQQVDEGPLGQAVAKGVGSAVKGVGALSGGIRGAWDAAKQGYQSGRAAVSGQPAPQQAAAPAISGVSKAQPTGAAAAAIDKTQQAVDQQSQAQANQTMFAQIQANIDKLDTKGKQNILKFLQQSLKQPQQEPLQSPLSDKEREAHRAAGGKFDGQTGAPIPIQPAQATQEPAATPADTAQVAATAAPAQEPAATPAAEPTQVAQATPAAEPAATAAPAQEPAATATEPTEPAQAAQEPAATPAEPAATAAPAQTSRAQGGGKIAGQLSQTPGAIKKRQARAAAKGQAEPAQQRAASQAEIDAERDRVMGNFTDSILRSKDSLKEALAKKVIQQKRKMFESSLATRQTSIYKK